MKFKKLFLLISILLCVFHLDAMESLDLELEILNASLYKACEEGNYERLRSLIDDIKVMMCKDKSLDIHTVINTSQDGPLHQAAFYGYCECLNALLKLVLCKVSPEKNKGLLIELKKEAGKPCNGEVSDEKIDCVTFIMTFLSVARSSSTPTTPINVKKKKKKNKLFGHLFH